MSTKYTYIPNRAILKELSGIQNVNIESSFLIINDSDGNFSQFAEAGDIMDAGTDADLITILEQPRADQITSLFTMISMNPEKAWDNYNNILEQSFNDYIDEIIEDKRKEQEQEEASRLEKTSEEKEVITDASLEKLLEDEMDINFDKDQGDLDTTESPIDKEIAQVESKNEKIVAETKKSEKSYEQLLSEKREKAEKLKEELAAIEDEIQDLEIAVRNNREKEEYVEKVKNEMSETVKNIDTKNMKDQILSLREKLEKLEKLAS